MLTTIHITVRDRVPTITAGEDVISHNSDYAAEFEFDEEWQDKVKTVYFVCEDGSYQAVVMSGNSCGVPMLDGEHRRIFVGVQAGAAEKPSILKTTRPCCLKVKDSIADYLGQPIPDPTPDVYEQIIAMLESITSPTWDAVQNKPFSTLGSGLSVDENGVLSAQGGGGGSANAVQYVAQTLTDEQKKQARANIDADKKRIIYNATRDNYGKVSMFGNASAQNAAIDKIIAEYKAGTEVVMRLQGSDYQLNRINENAGKIWFSSYLVDTTTGEMDVVTFTLGKDTTAVDESFINGIKAVGIDSALTMPRYAADAKAVGDALNQKLDKNQGAGNAGKILGIGEDGIVVPQDIPQGGDNSLGITTAAVGQIIKVKSVDTTGKPTEWEAADMGGKVELIASGTIEEVASLLVTKDSDGNALSLKNCYIMINGTLDGIGSTSICFRVADNTSNTVWDRYEVECKLKKDSPTIRATYVAEQGKIPVLYTEYDLSSTAFVTNDTTVQFAIYRNNATGRAFEPLHHTINQIMVGNNQGNGKLAAGTKYEIYGVRA